MESGPGARVREGVPWDAALENAMGQGSDCGMMLPETLSLDAGIGNSIQHISAVHAATGRDSQTISLV